MFFFSIAEYNFNNSGESISAFEHEHDEYEFVIPLKTISLLYYDKASYIGEVGFIYPVNPYVSHGFEFNIASGHFYSIVIAREYVEQIKKKYGLENNFFYARFLSTSFLLTLLDIFKLFHMNRILKKKK